MLERRGRAGLGALVWFLAERALPANPSAFLLVLRTAWRLGLTPAFVAAEHLSEVLPELTGGAAREAARRASWLELKRRAFRRLQTRLGSGALVRHVRLRDEAGLAARAESAAPTILLTWHYGVLRLIAPALDQLGLRVLVVRKGAASGRSGSREVQAGPVPSQRAFALGSSLAHLRAGGSVLLAADGEGSELQAACLGRLLTFSRGAFALSRLSGAPIVPVVALASEPGPGAEIWAQVPLSSGCDPRGDDFEQKLVREAARRLETLIQEHPGEIQPRLLHRFRVAPRLGPVQRAGDSSDSA